jgi:hypothetical protein
MAGKVPWPRSTQPQPIWERRFAAQPEESIECLRRKPLSELEFQKDKCRQILDWGKHRFGPDIQVLVCKAKAAIRRINRVIDEKEAEERAALRARSQSPGNPVNDSADARGCADETETEITHNIEIVPFQPAAEQPIMERNPSSAGNPEPAPTLIENADHAPALIDETVEAPERVETPAPSTRIKHKRATKSQLERERLARSRRRRHVGEALARIGLSVRQWEKNAGVRVNTGRNYLLGHKTRTNSHSKLEIAYSQAIMEYARRDGRKVDTAKMILPA